MSPSQQYSSRGGSQQDEERDDEGSRGRGRGFAAMDPERRREIAREGGRASHGGRSRWEDREDEENEENEVGERGRSSSSRGGTSRYDEEGGRGRGERRDEEDDEEERGGRSYGRGRGRGFASMDPQRQREIAAEGGRASHEQGSAHEWDSEEAAEAGRRGGQASHGGHGSSYESQRERGYRGRDDEDRRERWDEDRDREERSYRRSGGRGFAGMDPERQREIAAEGGRAAHARGSAHEFDSEEAAEAGRHSHGGRGSSYESEREGGYRRRSGDYDDERDDRSSSRSQGRGFAGMDPERQREIAAKGGRASHGGRGSEREDDEEEYGRSDDRDEYERDRSHSGGPGRRSSGWSGSSMRGGTREQHAEAGRQSHRNR